MGNDCVKPPGEPEPELWACQRCGKEFDRETFSHSVDEHHPDCRGDCNRCPVEVECGPIVRVRPGEPDSGGTKE